MFITEIHSTTPLIYCYTILEYNKDKSRMLGYTRATQLDMVTTDGTNGRYPHAAIDYTKDKVTYDYAWCDE
jgi:hypothetical protein